MDDGNADEDPGLPFLFDILRNNDPNWLRTNEFDDLLANLQALEALIWATSESPLLWKWVIIAVHTTLQSLAVCKLTRTDGFGAKSDNIERKIARFYEEGKNTYNDDEEFSMHEAKENMASFPTLMRRLGYDVPEHGNFREERNLTNLALYFLHDFRSTYIHYPPVQMSLDASQVRNIVKIAVSVVSLEIHKDDWKRRPLITLDEVTPLLDSIRRRFEEFDKD